jgi:toxin-antitoxin system PIN domain toxin
MRLSIDTNLFIYAADPDSPYHEKATAFFSSLDSRPVGEVFICGLVLIEIYMQLRNPAVFRSPYSSQEAADFCHALKTNPAWSYIDYSDTIFDELMKWAATTERGFRNVIDARIALTLRHYRVTEFATANVKDFQEFGFQKLWNPVAG